MGQIQGVRTAGGDVKLIKDVGEYDVWSSAIFTSVQAADLYIFSYSLGGAIAGAAAVTATKAETNLNVANAFVDESMNVYGIAIQIARITPAVFQPGGAVVYPSVLADWLDIEAKSHFGFYIGGDKPFAEGKLLWFGEAGGFWGYNGAAGASILANNVPTPASARVWKYTLPIGRIEKFWGRFEFPRGPLAMGAGPGSPAGALGNIQVLVRLLGVRTRGVQ
jgi:hypothetical protein